MDGVLEELAGEQLATAHPRCRLPRSSRQFGSSAVPGSHFIDNLPKDRIYEGGGQLEAGPKAGIKGGLGAGRGLPKSRAVARELAAEDDQPRFIRLPDGHR